MGPYSNVLHDGQTYHFWYHVMDDVQWDRGHTNGCVCYARSSDGIHWEKPSLGLVAYAGSRSNNIVVGHGAAGLTLGQDGGLVFLDPTAGPAERFRLACRFGALGQGLHILSSPDGIHWQVTHTNIVNYLGGEMPEFPKQTPANAGPLHTQFAASRDGIKWNRYGRRRFVPLGMKGEFDWASARMIHGLVPDTSGREMFIPDNTTTGWFI